MGAHPSAGSPYALDTRQRNSKPHSLAAHYPPAWQDLALGERPFIPGSPLLKRGKFAQALIDVACVGIGILFACVSAGAIGASVFILLFVKT